MTDPSVAARLRDVLSDELLEAHTYADGDASYVRERLVGALEPFLSSLLEERERSIQEALKAIHAALRSDEKGEFWAVRRWLDMQNVFHADLQGLRVVEVAAEHLLSRLASSPAQRQEKS